MKIISIFFFLVLTLFLLTVALESRQPINIAIYDILRLDSSEIRSYMKTNYAEPEWDKDSKCWISKTEDFWIAVFPYKDSVVSVKIELAKAVLLYETLEMIGFVNKPPSRKTECHMIWQNAYDNIYSLTISHPCLQQKPVSNNFNVLTIIPNESRYKEWEEKR